MNIERMQICSCWGLRLGLSFWALCKLDSIELQSRLLEKKDITHESIVRYTEFKSRRKQTREAYDDFFSIHLQVQSPSYKQTLYWSH